MRKRMDRGKEKGQYERKKWQPQIKFPSCQCRTEFNTVYWQPLASGKLHSEAEHGMNAHTPQHMHTHTDAAVHKHVHTPIVHRQHCARFWVQEGLLADASMQTGNLSPWVHMPFTQHMCDCAYVSVLVLFCLPVCVHWNFFSTYPRFSRCTEV